MKSKTLKDIFWKESNSMPGMSPAETFSNDEKIVRGLSELDTYNIQQLHVCKTQMRHGMFVLLRPEIHVWIENERDHLDEELVMERLVSVDARPDSLLESTPVRDTTDDVVHRPNVAQLRQTCTLLVFFGLVFVYQVLGGSILILRAKSCRGLRVDFLRKKRVGVHAIFVSRLVTRRLFPCFMHKR
jgi:hypothetical protein